MFKNIMIPVDMRHTDRESRVFDIAAILAKVGGGTLHLVHVGSTPTGDDSKSDEEQE